jgi:site-specific recombinase XerD
MALTLFPSGETTSARKGANHETRSGSLRFESAGVQDGHAHRFRGTLAVNLFEQGVPIEDVSQILEHEGVETTPNALCTRG